MQLDGIPITVRTDTYTAFIGRLFRDFSKKRYIKLIYEKPGLHILFVEREVRTLKEHLTKTKAGKQFGQAFDMSLEAHTGRLPNTELINLQKLDRLQNLTKKSISAKTDTLQVN